MKRSGFTLVELAIVLTVIGFLAIAIIAGSTLIEQSKMRKVYAEAREHAVSINTFKFKYGAWPGDIPNATDFFSSCAAGDAPTGCNGNGDDKIGTSPTDTAERYRFWQHLQYAGLVKFRTTGIAFGSGPASKVSTNMPPSSVFQNGGYSVSYNSAYGNVIRLGTDNPSADTTNVPSNPVISANLMHGFDDKYDDGLPGAGNIRASKGYSAGYNCYTGTDGASTSTYDVASNDPLCSLIFIGLF